MLQLEGRTGFGASSKFDGELSVGALYSCTVTDKSKHGIDVKVADSAVKGFIPTAHLSDLLSNCDVRRKILKVGNNIDDVALVKKGSNWVGSF